MPMKKPPVKQQQKKPSVLDKLNPFKKAQNTRDKKIQDALKKSGAY